MRKRSTFDSFQQKWEKFDRDEDRTGAFLRSKDTTARSWVAVPKFWERKRGQRVTWRLQGASKDFGSSAGVPRAARGTWVT